MSFTHLRVHFSVIAVCSNIQHPTYELGMQMNLLSPTPPARPPLPLLPPVFSFSFKLRQSRCVGLGYGDGRAGNKSSAPLHQHSAVCYRCAEADVSWNSETEISHIIIYSKILIRCCYYTSDRVTSTCISTYVQEVTIFTAFIHFNGQARVPESAYCRHYSFGLKWV